MKRIRQGEIYLANLNPALGHEQKGFRPVLVLQNNILNKNLNTVIVAPITSSIQGKNLLTTVELPKEVSGLSRDSVALLFQMRTLDKKRLERRVAQLGSAFFAEIIRQMRFIF